MTYLEIVNAVLMRMREDTVSTLTNQSDVVVNLVKEFVKDAVETVEAAHNWSGMYHEWDETTTAGVSTVQLTNTKKYAKIKEVHIELNGNEHRLLHNKPLSWIKERDPFGSDPQEAPMYWAVTANHPTTNNVTLRMYPTPDAAYNVKVSGYKKNDVLAADDDTLTIPTQPVMYIALALAARERGEVGGQTAAELFAMANRFLSDTIALDADMSDLDFVWETV